MNKSFAIFFISALTILVTDKAIASSNDDLIQQTQVVSQTPVQQSKKELIPELVSGVVAIGAEAVGFKQKNVEIIATKVEKELTNFVNSDEGTKVFEKSRNVVLKGRDTVRKLKKLFK